MLINSTTQGGIYFVGPELDLPISLRSKLLKIAKSFNWFFSHRELPHCISSPPSSVVLPDQIYFFPPERDKEMKINDKISSQTIKQNEGRTHGANQINLFLKSNPFPALAPHALSCSLADYSYTLSPPSLFLFFLSATCMKHLLRSKEN